jgi:hypothetical protein
MKILLCGLLLWLGNTTFAISVPSFTDTDNLIKKADQIIIAECISEKSKEYPHLYDVTVMKVLKGSEIEGHRLVSTIYKMEPSMRYMLVNLSGFSIGTNFTATAELSVIPLSTTFSLDELKGKELKEQIQYIYSAHLFDIERKLEPLLTKKELLEHALADRQYEWYQPVGPIKLGQIVEGSTITNDGHSIYLDLQGKKLAWSSGSPGKTGYFYFEKTGFNWTPYWEFAPCDVTRIEDLDGKSIKARFYGLFTPGRKQSHLGWTGSIQSIQVKVGEVLLARNTEDSQTIFVVQILGQQHDQECMRYRYTSLHKDRLGNRDP